MSGEGSMPATLPGPVTSAAGSVCPPVPHPTSSTRSPGLIPARSTISRLVFASPAERADPAHRIIKAGHPAADHAALGFGGLGFFRHGLLPPRSLVGSTGRLRSFPVSPDVDSWRLDPLLRQDRADMRAVLGGVVDRLGEED